MDRPQTLHVEKPWGSFDQYALNTPCTVKIITCEPGESLSLQKHAHRDEIWVALDDGVVVDLDDKTIYPLKGQEIWLQRGSVHRLRCEVSTGQPVRVLEISLGDFDENDIERLEDSYGRV
ncbi:MAG: phosphomannose isomerase type II C-terminal cupin domain [Holophagales bacterium]|jgi:mannose-1-phosphate guanylyltransferase/mannose-6-phosphate isomerase|nr:phosphomannose isomerase type II C-terminal cupin domain [Holophagales bacterium]